MQEDTYMETQGQETGIGEEDLYYDDDFEELPTPSGHLPEVTPSRSQISDPIEGSHYDDDFYSALSSKIGPEVALGSEIYGEDFCSPAPSGVLDARSDYTFSDSKLPAAQQNIDIGSNSPASSVIEIADKIVLPNIVPLGTSSPDDDDLYDISDKMPMETKPPCENADHSVYEHSEQSPGYEDDFAVSDDDAAGPVRETIPPEEAAPSLLTDNNGSLQQSEQLVDRSELEAIVGLSMDLVGSVIVSASEKVTSPIKSSRALATENSLAALETLQSTEESNLASSSVTSGDNHVKHLVDTSSQELVPENDKLSFEVSCPEESAILCDAPIDTALALSAVTSEWVSEMVASASQKVLTAFSPAKPIAFIAVAPDDDYDYESAFEEADSATKIAATEGSGGVFVSCEADQPSPTCAASPRVDNVEVVAPECAEPASTNTPPRPTSAQLAKAFIDRTLSQAQVNVVLGSPTRGLAASAAAASGSNEEPQVVSSNRSEDVDMICLDKAEPDQLILQVETFPSLHVELPHATLAVGEAAMNDKLGSQHSLSDGDAHNKSSRSVAYDDFLGTLGLATPSVDSKKAAQLRAAVSENRENSTPTKPPMSKKAQEEADRTFLTSIQYKPPAQANKKIIYSNSAANIRPASSKQLSPTRRPVTKRDLLRARSAGPKRPVSPPQQQPQQQAPPLKGSTPKRVPRSPPRQKQTGDHRTLFVPPPLCLPSQMLPKELVNYLFDSSKESELKISLFCQHGRHFSHCRAELCIDAHEKYRWLNLMHQKAREACDLVCEGDQMWRNKLETSLAEEIAEKKASLEKELAAVGAKITKKHNASVKLLKQGVCYYESILPALHRGDVTAQELHKSTGWTEEHYENFKRRLVIEEDRAHFRRQLKLDQLAHKHLGILENLKASLISPMMYLDGMLKSRLDKIHSAVKRIDLCFQYSIKLAIGIGKGKTEEELKAECEARSPMRNAIMAERMQRNTKHGFEILKASLASVADVCSEVRLMYQGIKRDHDAKQDKRSADAAHSPARSPSPTRRSSSPNGRNKQGRPQSAPAVVSPARKSSRPRSRAARSATTRSEAQVPSRDNNQAVNPLAQASKMSYAEDFESHGSGEEVDAEESIEIHDGTYEEQMSEMMRDMLGDDGAGRRASRASRGSRSRGSSSVIEDAVEEIEATEPRPKSNKNNVTSTANGVRAFPSLTLSVGGSIEEDSSGIVDDEGGGKGLSAKGVVMAKARDLALSRSPGGAHHSPAEKGGEDGVDSDEIASEEEDEMGFGTAGDGDFKVSVGNMYEDDFVGDEDSLLLKGAFSGKNKRKGGSSKKKSRKFKNTSQKVAHLMSTDPFAKTLSTMKHTQLNEQNILHGILLSHNIPLYYGDEPETAAAQKLKPLVVTDNYNRPVLLKLSSPGKRAKSADPLRESQRAVEPSSASDLRRSSVNPRASMIKSIGSLQLSTERLAAGQLRCFQCLTLFAAAQVKHLPTTAVSSDSTVFERAKARQRETGNLFPTYEKVQVTSSSDVQKQWVLDQQAKQQRLVGAKDVATQNRRSSVTLQKYEHPFCTWECVKTWAHINCTAQQRYQNDILIDVTAGYTVQVAPVVRT